MNKPLYLFPAAFIAIISIYFFVFGENKTLEMIKDEYLYILSLIPISATFLYFKFNSY